MEIQKDVLDIDLSDIDISPYNVRKDIDPKDEHIIELAKSIEEFGQLQPVVLLGSKPKYKLIVGQRRYYALKYLGKKKIKAVFLDLDGDKKIDTIKATVVSLSENIHRVQLTFEDMVGAITKLYDHYNSAKKVAHALGVSIQTIYGYLKVERFITPKIQKWIKQRSITKEDIKRAIVIAKGDKSEIESVLSELMGMTGFQKNRAVNERREKPNESTKTVMQKSKTYSSTDILTLNLSSEMEKALQKAKEELKEERETIALNALRIWLFDNKFLK